MITRSVGIKMLEAIIGFVLSLIALGIGLYIFLYPAFKAEDKGSSFWGFFLLCFVAWPIAFIWAVFILEDKHQSKKIE